MSSKLASVTGICSLLLALCFTSDPITAQKAKEPFWGSEFSTPENAEEVRSLLKSFSEGQDSYLKYFDQAVFIGPCLWARLLKQDKGLNSYATIYEDRRDDDRRSFLLRILFSPKLKHALKSPAFKLLGSTFLNGTYRAGTSSERNVIYQMSAIRATNPLTVVQVDKAVLAIYFADSKVQAIEMVSDW